MNNYLNKYIPKAQKGNNLNSYSGIFWYDKNTNQLFKMNESGQYVNAVTNEVIDSLPQGVVSTSPDRSNWETIIKDVEKSNISNPFTNPNIQQLPNPDPNEPLNVVNLPLDKKDVLSLNDLVNPETGKPLFGNNSPQYDINNIIPEQLKEQQYPTIQVPFVDSNVIPQTVIPEEIINENEIVNNNPVIKSEDNNQYLPETSDVVNYGQFQLPNRVPGTNSLYTNQPVQQEYVPQQQENTSRPGFFWQKFPGERRINNNTNSNVNIPFPNIREGLKKIGNQLGTWNDNRKEKNIQRKLDRDAPYVNELDRINLTNDEIKQANQEMKSLMRRERLDSIGERKENKLERKLNKLDNMYDRYEYKQDGGELGDNDFDYSMDVDIDTLNKYLNGGLIKAQNGLNWNDKQYTYPEQDNATTVGYTPQMDTTKITNDQLITPNATDANRFNTPYWLGKPNIELPTNNEPEKKRIINQSPSGNNYRESTNPYYLENPGDRLQMMSQLAPLGRAATIALSPLAERKLFHTDPILNYKGITTDYNPIREAESAAMDANRNNSRSAQQYMGNALNIGMQAAKQRAGLANQVQNQNNQLEQQRINQINQNNQQLDQKRQQVDQLRMADKVRQQDAWTNLSELVGQHGKNWGQMVNQQQVNNLKLQATNEKSQDYEIRKLGDGRYEYVHKTTGQAISPEQYDKEIQDAIDARLAEQKRIYDERMAKYEQSKPKLEKVEGKKIGGKIEIQPKRFRNRLYM